MASNPQYLKSEELGITHWPANPGPEFTVGLGSHYVRGSKFTAQCGAVILNCFPYNPSSYLSESDRIAYGEVVTKLIVGAEWKAREFGYGLMLASLLNSQSYAASVLVARGWTEHDNFTNVRNGKNVRWFSKHVPDPIWGLPEF